MAPKPKTKDGAERDEILPGGGIHMSDGTVFVPGDEELLAEVLTAEQAEYLRKEKAIAGFKHQPHEAKKTGAQVKSEAQVIPTLGGPPKGKAAEPLGMTLGLNADKASSDEVAAAYGGAPLGSDPVGATTAKGVAKAGKKKAAPAEDFDSMTVAELAEYLGKDAPTKGSGSNGQVTKADLVKAAKKASK